MKKLCAIYVRVSTQEQSCDLQREDLLKYVVSRDWEIYQIYEDKKTGTNGNRPMLKQMLIDAKEHKFDVLLCWKLDRLFRSLKDLLFTLQELAEYNVEFIAHKDQIDLTTSAGRLMMQILGSISEFEASLIRSRVKAGLESARAKGIQLGRKKSRDSELIRSLYESGHNYRRIAALAKVSVGTVAQEIKEMRCLKNPISEQT